MKSAIIILVFALFGLHALFWFMVPGSVGHQCLSQDLDLQSWEHGCECNTVALVLHSFLLTLRNHGNTPDYSLWCVLWMLISWVSSFCSCVQRGTSHSWAGLISRNSPLCVSFSIYHFHHYLLQLTVLFLFTSFFFYFFILYFSLPFFMFLHSLSSAFHRCCCVDLSGAEGRLLFLIPTL